MAKGQHLSSHQKSIVNRYYANLDSITLNKLQEIVSDLYLAADEKSRDKLWNSARAALGKSGLEPAEIEKTIASRSAEVLANVVSQLGRK